MPPFTGTKLLGVDLAARDTAPQHVLGGRVIDEQSGSEWIYVKAGGVITQYAPVKLANGFIATVSGNAGIIMAVADAAFASGEYGWVQTRGACSVAADSAAVAGAGIARIANVSGQAVAVAAGTGATIGVFLTADVSNVAPAYLY